MLQNPEGFNQDKEFFPIPKDTSFERQRTKHVPKTASFLRKRTESWPEGIPENHRATELALSGLERVAKTSGLLSEVEDFLLQKAEQDPLGFLSNETLLAHIFSPKFRNHDNLIGKKEKRKQERGTTEFLRALMDTMV